MLSSTPFLFHGQTSEWVYQEGNSLVVRFLCHDPKLQITTFFVRCEPDNEQRLVTCERIELDLFVQQGTIYEARIPLNQHIDTTSYVIKCLTATGQIWLSAKGMHSRIPGRETHFKFNALYQPPTWVRGQVFYQIFPDRFCNANKNISVQTDEYLYQGGCHRVIAKQWGEPVSQGGHEATGASEFYGGDLLGIQKKLDYLQDLGVSALYLNPIFTSPSNHKYDTTDYLNIDPHLGSNEEFAGLTQELHQRGMKVVLDAVFNHTSCEHPWFGRYQKSEHGAYKQSDSPYREHYLFDDPLALKEDYYIGWKAVETLPKLNFINPDVQDYLYKAETSVLKHWLKSPYHIDGWRFDVIHMLGEGTGAYNNSHYVKAFRESAKAVNPDSYIIGEHFYEATQWLQGEQEDGAMNYYGFAHPVRAFFTGVDIAYHPVEIDAQAFDEWLSESRAKIPWLNQLAQLNQLDSHDTMRFITLLDGDTNRLAAASMMLFSYPGTPCIYYGTEVGLQGGHDPDNRRCFPWDQLDEKRDLFSFYQRLIALRKQRTELQEGSYRTLYAQRQCFVFARYYQGKTTLYGVNLGDSAENIHVDRLMLMGSAACFSGFDNYNQSWRVVVEQRGLNFTLEPKSALLLSSQDESRY